ncbi:MAG: hypothetical protein PUD89_03155, partial [Bacteroidales bacterium]|nr:hypothetical protein [Bacteroidales bacterium]
GANKRATLLQPNKRSGRVSPTFDFYNYFWAHSCPLQHRITIIDWFETSFFAKKIDRNLVDKKHCCIFALQNEISAIITFL